MSDEKKRSGPAFDARLPRPAPTSRGRPEQLAHDERVARERAALSTVAHDAAAHVVERMGVAFDMEGSATRLEFILGCAANAALAALEAGGSEVAARHAAGTACAEWMLAWATMSLARGGK